MKTILYRLGVAGLMAGLLSAPWCGLAHAGAVDAPELAQAGPAAVGYVPFKVHVSEPAGQPARDLNALLWYPATGSDATTGTLTREVAAHPWRGWTQSATATFTIKAKEGAEPLAPEALPVLIVSHGLMNVAESFHAMAEHLASRGYAVVTVQHDDDRHADPLKAAIGLRPFDQAAVLQQLRHMAEAAPWKQRLRLDKIGLLGYSMGGYGALLSAGARLDTQGMVYHYTPLAKPHAEVASASVQALRDSLGAVIAMAPWGAQSQLGGFKPQGLANVRVPLLMIAGDQDDISGYADGTRSAWLAASQAPRWLLTFENARHNIAHGEMPTGLPNNFATWQGLEEPVWRRDRLVDINNHFITAFLDVQLRGKTDRAAYLRVPTERSNDATWPHPPFTPPVLSYAGAPKGDIQYWQGFQRRWALGLKLEHRQAGQE